jgi:hypothetical protein
MGPLTVSSAVVAISMSVSNRSLPTFEPVSVRDWEFSREKVWRGQRPRRHFWRHQPISGDRDRAIPPLRRQSHGTSKTIPTAPGNGSYAGLGGGAGRTRTDNQPIMGAAATPRRMRGSSTRSPRREQSRIASATKATGLTVGCMPARRADRAYWCWPPHRSTGSTATGRAGQARRY